MLPTSYDKSEIKHIPTIIIKSVPHDEQLYETCGDWRYNEKGELVITVSETNAKYEFLVALHEICEAMLCEFSGVKEKDVTDFDLEFERMREQFPKIVGDKEPGDEDAAPYQHPHRISTRLERFIARDILGADADAEWTKYEETINSLKQF